MSRNHVFVPVLGCLIGGCSLIVPSPDDYIYGRDSGAADSGVDASIRDAGADSSIDGGTDAGPCSWEGSDGSSVVCDPPTAIAAGDGHTCAVRSSGALVCWGFNDDGQLGTGEPVGSNVPVPVAGFTGGELDGVTEVDGGSLHTCALLSSGQVACWGSNARGQLGDGGSDSRVPVLVSDTGIGTLGRVESLALGSSHSCAVVSGQRARCWGSNTSGQLGDGTSSNRPMAVSVTGMTGSGNLEGVVQLAAGAAHTCARLASGEVACWGSNDRGQLGDGTLMARLNPTLVRNEDDSAALAGVAEIAAGAFHTCARLLSGEIRCWGYGMFGQLGNGATDDQALPASVLDEAGALPLSGSDSIFAHGTHTCALLAGEVLCWGANGDGRLGIGEDSTAVLTPRRVVDVTSSGELSGVDGLALGGQHCCALRLDDVYCWGFNARGALGDGTTSGRNFPGPVTPPS